MLTIKQSLMLNFFKDYYGKIHKKTTVFSEEYCKKLVKDTIDKIYEIYPDRNVGKISLCWFDEKFNRPAKIDENTYCFEVTFHDANTGIPWAICRFYKKISGGKVYVCQ